MNHLRHIILIAIAVTFPWNAYAAGTKILFLRKTGKAFDEVFESMKKDLKASYEIEDYVVGNSATYDEVKNTITAKAPGFLVLMDNQPLEFALKFNAEQKDPKKKIKGTALMGLNLKAILKGNPEISGVAFESPGYTMLVQFRFILKKPLKKVLVFYRKSLFQDTIDAATKQLQADGITLNSINVESEGRTPEAVEKFVEQNLKKYSAQTDNYDVIWVLLDSGILTRRLFKDVWVPSARESKIPFISGTEEFVAPAFNFATFAVTPNLVDLGGQAVQQIESILKDHVAPKELGVEELISVNKVLNMDRVHELGLSLKEENLKEIKTVP